MHNNVRLGAIFAENDFRNHKNTYSTPTNSNFRMAMSSHNEYCRIKYVTNSEAVNVSRSRRCLILISICIRLTFKITRFQMKGRKNEGTHFQDNSRVASKVAWALGTRALRLMGTWSLGHFWAHGVLAWVKHPCDTVLAGGIEMKTHRHLGSWALMLLGGLSGPLGHLGSKLLSLGHLLGHSGTWEL
jgi:hypothetical protein